MSKLMLALKGIASMGFIAVKILLALSLVFAIVGISFFIFNAIVILFDEVKRAGGVRKFLRELFYR